MARKPSTRRLSLKDQALYHQATQLPLGRPAQARVRKCELTFPDGILSVVKGADNIWRCPRCKQEFGGDARSLKDHARSGACMARARGGAVRQRASGVRLRIGPLRTGDGAGDIEFIARRTRSGGPEDGADEDAFDMHEVLMKLEDENEGAYAAAMDEDAAPPGPEPEPEPAHTAGAREGCPVTPPPGVASMGPAKIAADAAGTADAHAPETGRGVVEGAAMAAAAAPHASAPASPRDYGATVRRSPRERGATAEATNANAAAALILLSSPVQAIAPPSAPCSPTGPSAAAQDAAAPAMSASTPHSPTPANLTARSSHPTENGGPSSVPPALGRFLDTLLAKGDFLAEIFVQRGFDSEVALDLLCESAQEEEYRWLIQAIQAQSHLVSLAVKRGLREREAALGAARAAAAASE